MSDFDAAFRRVVKRHYGRQPHRHVRNADTMYGITQREYIMWRADHHLGWGNVVGIGPTELKAYYLERYWREAVCDGLPAEVREIHLDAAACHHVGRAVLLLQQAARVEEKGLGMRTLDAVHAMAPAYLYARYVAVRYRFYGEILQRDYGEIANVGDWMSGMAEFAL